MARTLSDTDVADFRDRMCAAAARLFAEHGVEAVTMRQLAAELGVSPMTPYRYFQDKDAILAAVRAHGFKRLAAALEAALGRAKARATAAGLRKAYLDFAFEHDSTFRLMFDPHQPSGGIEHPAVEAASLRVRDVIGAWARDQVASGRIAGDPEEIGAMFWAATHGAVTLEMAGKLPEGAARELDHQISVALGKGLQP